jgi:hypothetical protein
MIGKFWELAGGKLADRWMAAAGPALVFWLGGLLAWVSAGPGGHRLDDVTRWLDRRTAPAQLVTLVVALLVVVACAMAVHQAGTGMLRLLEGYWPAWARRPRRALEQRVRDRAGTDRTAFTELHRARARLGGEDVAGRSALDRELAAIELRAHRRPPPTEVMPTAVGNILRATEVRPATKYGLDGVVVWPHLWLLLPDAVRQELAAARKALDTTAAAVVWGLAFCLFTPLAWWALPAGLAVAAAAAIWWAPRRAAGFADLVDAAFDLHRFALYQQLRWPLPETPEQERAGGGHLTDYLWRGTPPPDGFRFTT